MFINEQPKLSNKEIIDGINNAWRNQRRYETVFLKYLNIVNEKRIFLMLGYSSLFMYLVKNFNMSEPGASKRIRVAMAAKRYPVIYTYLEKGEIHITGLFMLAPYLTAGNHLFLLSSAVKKSKNEIEKLIAGIAPKEDVADSIRKLPTSNKEENNNILPLFDLKIDRQINAQKVCEIKIEPKVNIIKPLSTSRQMIKFTASDRLVEKIKKVRGLLKHKYYDGKLEDIFEEVIDIALAKIDPDKQIAKEKTVNKVKSGTRHITKQIKIEIWKRDGGQCTFVGTDGRRCECKEGLEYDHIKPFADGGASSVENIRLMCRNHNLYLAEKRFGTDFIRKKIAKENTSY